MRLASAIHWYAKGEISQEKAALIAGLDRIDFLVALHGKKLRFFRWI
jgi:predicted HTH domain antitoxin